MPTQPVRATEDFTKDQAKTIKRILAKIESKQIAIARYNKYYSGQHEINFASEKFTTAFGRRLQNMRDNLCKTVVKAPADRLEVVGFSSQKTSSVYVESWETWKASKMPKISKRVHRDAFKTGDAFVLVWFGADDKASIVKQDPDKCCVFYDPETNEIELGAKVWRGLDDYVYLTVYFPDRLEKYVSKRTYKAGDIPKTLSAFQKRSVDGEAWPVPNEFKKCPMFHFGLESSILDDVIPLNDALNKQIADMLVSSESNSLRQRWSSGIAYETDPETGKQIIPFDRNSQWVATGKEEGKFGSFEDAALSDFLSSIKDFRSEIASVAGIPHYYFEMTTGDFPSGEALTKAESRFTSMIEDAQLDFGETWGEAVKLAMRIDGKEIDETPAATTGEGAADNKKATFETQWKPAAPMSENEKWDLAEKKKRVGLSQKRVLSELGYSDADIEANATEKNDEDAAAGEAFGKVFNAGGKIVGG